MFRPAPAVCGFPPEFCENGPNGKKWKKECGPWLVDNMAESFLRKYGLIDDDDDELAEGTEGMSLEDGKKKGEQTTKKGETVGKGDKVMPGGKVKKGGAEKRVTVEKESRNKRKFITRVIGLEHFGVNLKDASKVMKKKFSCGCAVVTPGAGKPDAIEIQGDFMDEALEMISEHKDFASVPEDKLFSKEGNKFKPY